MGGDVSDVILTPAAIPVGLFDAGWRLTATQVEALRAAYNAKLHGDGWMVRAYCRPWRRGPMAVYALERKGLLQLHRAGGRARLTDEGRQLIETFPQAFGFAVREGPR
jgi:hypothetical protein